MRPNRRRQAPGEPLPGESGRAELGDFAAKVLDVTEAIPAGRVMSYGDVAEYLGEGGPRQVGRVMALWGGPAPRMVCSRPPDRARVSSTAVSPFDADVSQHQHEGNGRTHAGSGIYARAGPLCPDMTPNLG